MKLSDVLRFFVYFFLSPIAQIGEGIYALRGEMRWNRSWKASSFPPLILMFILAWVVFVLQEELLQAGGSDIGSTAISDGNVLLVLLVLPSVFVFFRTAPIYDRWTDLMHEQLFLFRLIFYSGSGVVMGLQWWLLWKFMNPQLPLVLAFVLILVVVYVVLGTIWSVINGALPGGYTLMRGTSPTDYM